MAAIDPQELPPRSGQASSSTIIIRWWHETAPGSEVSDAALRGTVLDLGGRTLGQFAGRQALFDLVGGIIARPTRNSPPTRTGAADA